MWVGLPGRFDKGNQMTIQNRIYQSQIKGLQESTDKVTNVDAMPISENELDTGAGRGGKDDPRYFVPGPPFIVTLPDGTTYDPFMDPDSPYFDPDLMIPGIEPYIPPYMRPGFVPTPFDPSSPFYGPGPHRANNSPMTNPNNPAP